MKLVAITVFFILLMPPLSADQNVRIDSLYRKALETTDTAVAQRIYQQAAQLAKDENYVQGLALIYDKLGVINRNQSNYPQALQYHKMAWNLAENTNYILLKIQVLNNIGVVYRRLDDNKVAIDFHIKALQMAEKENDLKNVCIATNSIGNIYFALGQYQDALQYFRKALPLELKRGNLLGAAINNNNIGLVFSTWGKLDSALVYFKKSLDYNLKVKSKNGEAICYNDIGDVYLEKGDFKKADYFYGRALEINLFIGDEIYTSTSYTNIARASFLQKDFDKAIDLYKKSLEIALKIGSKSQAEIAYKGLSECYREKKNFEQALVLFQISVKYADSILNEKNLRHVAHMHAQYDSEKKQQQIILLQKEKRNSNLVAVIFAIAVFTIIIAVLFGYRSIVQKRKFAQQELNLQAQKIRELEKDRQLVASHAVLQGEDAERSRLARDLHDGLGGLLSGVKMALSGVKGNMVVSQKAAKDMDHVLDLLDSSIRELRRVAHNMMPAALVKYGLREALQDFCSQLDSRELSVVSQFFGDNKRLDKSLEITIYRIVQELVNNAIKHGCAKKVIVQLVKDSDRVHLTVQDDGQGFDLSQCSKGVGLENIKARAEALNGRFDIYSERGKGTEGVVEFFI